MPRIFETMENNFRLYKIIPLAILKCPVDVSNDLKCCVRTGWIKSSDRLSFIVSVHCFKSRRII